MSALTAVTFPLQRADVFIVPLCLLWPPLPTRTTTITAAATTSGRDECMGTHSALLLSSVTLPFQWANVFIVPLCFLYIWPATRAGWVSAQDRATPKYKFAIMVRVLVI